MEDGTFKGRLGAQAGSNFVLAAAVFLLFKYGFRGLRWQDAAYLVAGYIAAAVILGSLNWGISSWYEKRLQQQLSDGSAPITEMVFGSERTDQLYKKAQRLGTVLWFLSLGIGFACVATYDILIPR